MQNDRHSFFGIVDELHACIRFGGNDGVGSLSISRNWVGPIAIYTGKRKNFVFGTRNAIRFFLRSFMAPFVETGSGYQTSVGYSIFKTGQLFESFDSGIQSVFLERGIFGPMG